MCASLVEVEMEMKRAKIELPPIYARLEDIPEAKVESIIPVIHLDGQVDELLVNNVFRVQQDLTYHSHCK